MNNKYKIIPISLRIVNVFVIKGESIILVDTGHRKHGEKIVTELSKLNLQPEDIDLIVLTHGHDDHIGSLPYLKEQTNAKVLIHKREMYSIIEGRNVPIQGRNWLAQCFFNLVLKDYIRDYKSIQPDIVVDGDYSLGSYGIPAKVIPTPGHTPGSVSICFENEVITGDLIQPNTWYFIIKMLISKNDLQILLKSLHRVLAYHPKKVYISHGSVCNYETVKKFFE